MAYQSVHSGPAIDAAVTQLADIQIVRDESNANLATVQNLAAQVATDAGTASTAAASATQTLNDATAAIAAADHARQEQIDAEIAIVADQRFAAEQAATEAVAAADAAVVTVTQDMAASVPTPNKLPLADAQGKIASDWLGADVARAADVVRGDALAAADGAGLVGFQQSGAGAVARSAEAKLSERVTPEDFGAIGDGVADDTVALQKLVAYANSTDSVQINFKGFYRSTQTLAFVSNSLDLNFEALGKSGLLFIGCNGISVSQTKLYAGFSSSNMMLVTDSNKLYTGLSYTNSATSTGDHMPKILSGLVCIGKDRLEHLGAPYTQGWLKAVDVNNGDRLYIDDCWLQGSNQDIIDGFPVAAKGIVATGSTHLVVRNPMIFCFETGIEVTGQSEGFEVIRGAIVANKKGVNFSPNAAPANDTNIDGVHIASMEYNISLSGAVISVMHNITGCLLFTRNEPYVSADFKHITVDGSSQISGNYFYTAEGVAASGHVGVDLKNPATGVTVGITIFGNIFERIPTLVKIGSNVYNTAIFGNTTKDDALSLAAPPVVNAGAGTTIGFNFGNRSFGEALSSTGVFWSPTASPGFYVTNNKLIALSATAGSESAVNYLDVVNAATGNPVLLRSLGGDAAIDIAVVPKGAAAFRTNADNINSLGKPTNRWSVVYAGTGTINTSDEREKQQVRDLSTAERAVAVRLKSLIRAFKFNDAVAAKGSSARTHFGVIAQDVKAAFEAEGLVAEDYAILCYDEWDEQPETVDEDGNVTREYRPSGNRYGVRYEELLAFIIGAL